MRGEEARKAKARADLRKARADLRNAGRDYSIAMGALVGALVGITLWDTLPLLPRIVIVAWWVGAVTEGLFMLSDLLRWVRR